MKLVRLRSRLLSGALFISFLMSATFMLAVAWVINHQYSAQSQALLNRASGIIEDNLQERRENVLIASHQLAEQKHLGSTIWYLGQYAQADNNLEMLFVAYRQLAKDTFKIGRVAKLSKISTYDAAGRLIFFATFDQRGETFGFVDRSPEPVIKFATLHEGGELNRNNLKSTKFHDGVDLNFSLPFPKQDELRYSNENGMPTIEARLPVMDAAPDPATGAQIIRQLGLVVMVQPLDQTFVDRISKLSDVSVNVFTSQGLSSGNLPKYQTLILTGLPQADAKSFNEITVGGEHFYQHLMPLYANKQPVATIAVLSSAKAVRKNTLEMIGILAMISVVCLLLILPLSWYLASAISQPITALSKVFKGISISNEIQNHEIDEMTLKSGDEIADLTNSFIEMHASIKQKIQQINDINASLEDKVEQRTHELQLANDELTKLSMLDALTHLPNRRMLSDRLTQALALSKRTGRYGALMFIDLDNFKPLNDLHGHSVGDLLLIEVARRLINCMRQIDTVARFGGDEFVVMLSELEEDRTEATSHAATVAEKILTMLAEPYEILVSESTGENAIVHKCSASIGVAMFINHQASQDEIIKWADMAMYQAKEAGRNQIRFYEKNSIEHC